jgi:hypothetical protein
MARWERVKSRVAGRAIVAGAAVAALLALLAVAVPPPGRSAPGMSAGQLYAFGENYFGELGSTINLKAAAPNSTPALVALPGATGEVIKVAAGTYADLGVRSGSIQVVYIDKGITLQGGYTLTDWSTAYPITQPTQTAYEAYWTEKCLPQVRELLVNYAPDILWFDSWGEGHKPFLTQDRLDRLIRLVRTTKPDCLINSRIGTDQGVDYLSMGDNDTV